MAGFTEEFYYEYPEGYEPEEFTEPEVRSLEELREDVSSDSETWKKDLKAALTQEYMPAQQVYEQNEILRKLKYRIDDPEDDSPYSREELEAELKALTAAYDEGYTRAKEWIDEAFEEEIRGRALASFHILESSEDYEPGTEEDLLAGYEPAPTDPGVPASVYERMEDLRKLMYQLNRLDEDDDLADMQAPFEIKTPGEDALPAEDMQLVSKDMEHKKVLNSLFAKKTGLEDEFVKLAESLLEDEAVWQDEDNDLSEDDWDTIEELRLEILNDRAWREQNAA